MANARPLRPTLIDSKDGDPCPTGGTAYLMILKAIETQDGLVHGQLHGAHGDHCAIGSYFEINPKTALQNSMINEIAMVNDSVPTLTRRQRKFHVRRWLQWRLKELGMPGFEKAKRK